MTAAVKRMSRPAATIRAPQPANSTIPWNPRTSARTSSSNPSFESILYARIGRRALLKGSFGLGASARLHYAALPELIGTSCVVPQDADVANALGAVVGQVRMSVEATVSQPEEGTFRLLAGSDIGDFRNEEEAIAAAEKYVRAEVAARAIAAGGEAAKIEVSRELKTSEIQGRRMFIEAKLVAVATGRPRIASIDLPG